MRSGWVTISYSKDMSEISYLASGTFGDVSSVSDLIREWSLIMSGRGEGGGAKKPIILSKNFTLHLHFPSNFHAPINHLEIFSCPSGGVWCRRHHMQ